MPVFSIENFKYGLDDRRNQLSMASGSLNKLVNGHITTGGEIEKRLAFNKIALPTGCFGLEVTDKGLTTFGDQLRVVGAALGNIDSAGYLVAVTPSVYYQRLVHPNQYYIAGYEYASALTAVLSSTNYAGKAWVVAKFGGGIVGSGSGGSDGTFVYYDGVPVLQNFVGLVLPGVDKSSNQAEFLTFETNGIADLGWSNGFDAYDPATPWITAQSFLGAPSNSNFVPNITLTSANSGSLSYSNAIRPLKYEAVAGVPNDGAYFSMSFVGSGTCKIKIVVWDSVAPIVTLYDQQLLGASKTGAEWATFIADVINKTPIYWSGMDANEYFTAVAINDSVGTDGKLQIRAPAGFDNTYTYVVTGTSDLTIANEPISAGVYGVNTTTTVRISPSPSVTAVAAFNSYGFVAHSDAVTAYVTFLGDTATATYKWTFVSGDTMILLVGSDTSATVKFEALIDYKTIRSAIWKCEMTRTNDGFKASDLVTVTIGPKGV